LLERGTLTVTGIREADAVEDPGTTELAAAAVTVPGAGFEETGTALDSGMGSDLLAGSDDGKVLEGVLGGVPDAERDGVYVPVHDAVMLTDCDTDALDDGVKEAVIDAETEVDFEFDRVPEGLTVTVMLALLDVVTVFEAVMLPDEVMEA